MDISQEPFRASILSKHAEARSPGANFVRACGIEMHMVEHENSRPKCHGQDGSQPTFCASLRNRHAHGHLTRQLFYSRIFSKSAQSRRADLVKALSWHRHPGCGWGLWQGAWPNKHNSWSGLRGYIPTIGLSAHGFHFGKDPISWLPLNSSPLTKSNSCPPLWFCLVSSPDQYPPYSKSWDRQDTVAPPSYCSSWRQPAALEMFDAKKKNCPYLRVCVWKRDSPTSFSWTYLQ